MNNFIKIPYNNFHGFIMINANELKKVEPVIYKDETAAIEYHLIDEIIIQKFDYDYDPFEEHGEEWDKICKDECNEDCKQRKLSKDFEKKYESEAKGYNSRTMISIIKQIEKLLNVIDIGGELEGELTVIEKIRKECYK